MKANEDRIQSMGCIQFEREEEDLNNQDDNYE
jgi:hypothetical protein